MDLCILALDVLLLFTILKLMVFKENCLNVPTKPRICHLFADDTFFYEQQTESLIDVSNLKQAPLEQPQSMKHSASINTLKFDEIESNFIILMPKKTIKQTCISKLSKLYF